MRPRGLPSTGPCGRSLGIAGWAGKAMTGGAPGGSIVPLDNRARGARCAREALVIPAPSSTSAAPRHRTTHAGMRALLGAFAVLTALATIALFVLAENTKETFAWTIEPPLTAAFIGAGYGAGFVLVGLS